MIMSINKERIKKQIQRAIENLPTEIVLYRDDIVEVGRDSFETQRIGVAVFNGFLDNGSSRINQLVSNAGDFGRVTPIKSISLLAIDYVEYRLKRGDYFYIEGIRHDISYPKNNYGIYWECDVTVDLNGN